METWIRRSAHSRVRNQLIAWTVFTLIGIAIFIACNRYWTNFFGGPYTVTPEQLTQINDAARLQHNFVTVEAHKVIDTGVQEITTETMNGVKTGSHVSAGYYALFVGESALIVKDAKQPGLKVSGELKPMTPELLEQIAPNADERGHLYPFYLDTASYRSNGYVALACAAAWCVLLAIFGGRAVRRYGNIGLHPAVQRAEAWPYAADMLAAAEREKTTATRFKQRGVIITDHFVILEALFRFDIYPLEHLLWAYLKTTTTRYMGVIPIGKRSEAMLHFYGGTIQVPAGKNKVLEILNFIAHQAPWAFTGYSDQLQTQFNRNNAQFAAQVEQRRATIRAQWSGQPLPPQPPSPPSPSYDFTQPLAPPSGPPQR